MIPRSTLAGAIGNTVEWFDFAVYGYFAKEIGEPYFPADVPSLQLLSAFAVFAVGYLMRPIGGLLLVLICPTLDPSMASPSWRELADAPFLSAADMRWYYRHYAPDADDWRAAPLLGDLRNLPPYLGDQR